MPRRLGLSANGRAKEHTSETKGEKTGAQMPLDEARPEGFNTRVQGKIKTTNLRRDERGERVGEPKCEGGPAGNDGKGMQRPK